MSVSRVLFVGVLVIIGVEGVKGARILGLFPLPSFSHFAVPSALLKELANRGHQVTVYSPFPEKSPISNYTNIDTGARRDDFLRHTNVSNSFDLAKHSYMGILKVMWTFGDGFSNSFLQQKEVQKLLHSNDQQFDLIIMELFVTDALLGFVHKFRAPVVQVVSFGGSAWMRDLVGSPSPYSYVPDPLQEFSDRMSLWQRILNTLGITYQKLSLCIHHRPKQQAIMEKYFRDYAPLPSISELASSTSLILVNGHFSIGYPHPLMPNIVPVGGMHLKPAKKLPEDLQKFIDEAPEGVIYFSMGSGLHGSDMPAIKRQAFVEAFSKLKQRIIWKWEADNLPGKPQNVKIGKWFPQSDILAHPNVRLFITHGGLLSTQETIHWGVPVVGIPMLADQNLNMAQAVARGYGIQLDFANVTTESLEWALKEVLENSRYRENAQRLSRIFRDQPLTPLEQAVFWTEYVIRHKGAPHMRSAALDLTWYQYFLLDVIAVLALAVGSVVLIVFLMMRLLLRKLFGGERNLQEAHTSRKKCD
ncbi:UDP-glucuronosyltransferase 2B33 [Cryptotermes secundus]|uniref:UDP-glucuronosyltransferase n=4 Tax=Cryptotermes secundus TaxID=105785 RepID=A0A2J7Q342_9NEOP|nr:UDP-glucuronosyltransferase 2B33 [Cryptotermes secundus]